jgi:hypothetical protein
MQRLGYPPCHVAAAVERFGRLGTVEGPGLIHPDDVAVIDLACEADERTLWQSHPLDFPEPDDPWAAFDGWRYELGPEPEAPR